MLKMCLKATILKSGDPTGIPSSDGDMAAVTALINKICFAWEIEGKRSHY